MAEKFIVQVYGETSLTADEVWPDGDAPERPTAQDVAAVMQREVEDVEAVLRDWNLFDGNTELRMDVRGVASFATVFPAADTTDSLVS